MTVTQFFFVGVVFVFCGAIVLALFLTPSSMYGDEKRCTEKGGYQLRLANRQVICAKLEVLK